MSLGKKSLFLFMVILLTILTTWLAVAQYSFIFARKVSGVVIGIERVMTNMAVIQGASVNPQIFSFAVAIKENSGEIFTASAEDRQWAVVEKGKCVVSRFYPYPPWNFEKGGTYFNARLDKMYECETAAEIKTPAK